MLPVDALHLEVLPVHEIWYCRTIQYTVVHGMFSSPEGITAHHFSTSVETPYFGTVIQSTKIRNNINSAISTVPWMFTDL